MLLLALAAARPAQGASCDAASAMADHLDGWANLETLFDKYRACDDGEISEAISEAAMRLLVDHWQRLPQLARLAEREAPFKRFVLDHMDETVDPADLERVEQLASRSCPRGAARLCRDLKVAAAHTLRIERPAGR